MSGLSLLRIRCNTALTHSARVVCLQGFVE